jgi:hypothetical protein
VRAAHLVRLVMNVVNLSTPLGLTVAFAGRAHLRWGPDGLVLATGFRIRTHAPAFTIGNVLVARMDEPSLLARPRLIAHEARHATQYACCLGIPMLPLYAVAAGASWAWARDFSSYNPFERLAGLEDGGYPPVRPRRRRAVTVA